MRNIPRLFVHVIERTGLALVGGAAGLFVGIQTGATIPALTNPTFLLVMTVIGAVGFSPLRPRTDSAPEMAM